MDQTAVELYTRLLGIAVEERAGVRVRPQIEAGVVDCWRLMPRLSTQ